MIKIKLLTKKKKTNESKIASPLSKIQQHNLNFLLNGTYSHQDKYSSNSVADNFVEDMLNQKFERTGDADIFDEDVHPPPQETVVMEQLVRQIHSLRKSKIAKALTGASFGKIFKLSDDHILKIFLGGVNVEEDMEWYNKCYELMHKGEGKITTLPVYGRPGKLTIDGYDVWYVEMAEFKPLDKYLADSGRSEADTALGQLEASFKGAYSKGIKDKDGVLQYIYDLINIDTTKEAIEHLFYYLDLDKNIVTTKKDSDYIKFIFDYLDIDKSKFSSDIDDNIDTIYDKLGIEDDIQFSHESNPFKPLTLKEAEAIIQSFCDMLDIGFGLSDVAPRNMAVLKQSTPNNPSIIIFDR